MFEFLKNIFGRKKKVLTEDPSPVSNDVEKTVTAAVLIEYIPQSKAGSAAAENKDIADSSKDSSGF